MTEEAQPNAQEGLTETPPPSPAAEIPTDFREYAKWRATGELPAKPEETPQPAAAAEQEPAPAKTEPQSGADDTQQEDDEEEETEVEPTGRRRGSSRQRKIDRQAREIEQLKQQLAALQPKAEPPQAAAPPGKPKLENYPTLEAYQEALTDYNLDQREAKRKAEADAKAAAEAQEVLDRDWQKKRRVAQKAHADFDDVIDAIKAPEGPGVGAARQAMLEDEAGAEILYYLAKHPDELAKIAGFTPIGAVRAIGRLSALFTAPPAANGKQQLSAAPKPPPPSGRPATAASDSIDDPAVQSDFRRWSRARAAMKV